LKVRDLAASNDLYLRAVLGIRIRRICMFLGLPDPDQLDEGADTDPDPAVEQNEIMPAK
jgi:hypothetical protein